jgi:polysaccharide export outer membrane protein
MNNYHHNSMLLIMIICVLLTSGCTTPKLEKASYSVKSPAYVIGPGDTVDIFVWGNEELSASIPVRPDGKITTPLVEDVQASGKTPTELARSMEQRLKRYIKNPIVTVIVTEFVGRQSEQIRVIGKAQKPQAIPYVENMTLLDVMIAVGGLTEFAAGNSATIVRNVDGKQKEFRVRLDDLVKYGDITKNVDMFPGDILIIPESFF